MPKLQKNIEIKTEKRFEPLMELNNTEMNKLHDKFKTTTSEIAESLVGLRRNLKIEGLSAEVERLCKKQWEARKNMLRNPAAASIREVYKTLNKRIKHEIQVHKPKCLDQKIKQL